MADTSLIFNIIARDSGVGRTLDKMSSGFRSAGAAAENALDKAGDSTQNLDRQIEEANNRIRQMAREFERTGNKDLLPIISRNRSLVTQLSKVRDAVRDTGSTADRASGQADRFGSGLGRAASIAGNFAGSVMSAGSAASSALSSVSGLAIAAGGLAAFGTVGAPAVYAFAGALASIPAMVSGAMAAIGVLGMGMSGLGANWDAMNSPVGGGGGGGGGGGSAPKIDMTPKIRAVEAAQRDVAKSARDVTEAQASLREAQEAVAKAHDEAREKISDLNREYRQARADQAEATQGLVEAEQQLRLAQGRGNPEEIARAQLAVQRQRLEVEEAADRTDDLGKESADAARKGVRGSDEVTEARKRERDAQQRVRDAVENHRLAIQRLGDAQKALREKMDMGGGGGGGGGGLGRQLPRIAASAQEFLDKLRSLKPAFDALRLDVQQRLFAGLADKLQILADRWFPALHTHLGKMADMINGVVKTAFDSLSDPKFISNMMVGLDSFTEMVGKIGQAIAGPLVDAWGRLTRAASPILDVIGDKVSGLIIKFSDWIAKMDETGKLDKFMRDAAEVMGDVFDILEDIGRIAGSVVSILFGKDQNGTSSWKDLVGYIDQLATALEDPEVQASMSRWLQFFTDAAFGIAGFMYWLSQIPDKIREVGNWFKALPDRAEKQLSRLPGVVTRWTRIAINRMGYYIGYGIGWTVRQFMTLPGRIGRAIVGLPGVFARIGAWLIGAVSWLGPAMWNVGRNIVSGIWSGIQSMAGWLWNAVANFAAGIWRGAQAGLGIHSPSQVMADRVGKWIPAGIALGIDRNKGVVQEAMARMQDTLSGASLTAPAVSMDGAMAAATGTLTVAARRQRVEAVAVIDVRGQDGEFKRLIRGMTRTSNLNQDRK